MESTEPGGLRTREGMQRFDQVFDVRGTGARPQLPVRGVRGEFFWLQAPGLQLTRPLRLLHPRCWSRPSPRAVDRHQRRRRRVLGCLRRNRRRQRCLVASSRYRHSR